MVLSPMGMVSLFPASAAGGDGFSADGVTLLAQDTGADNPWRVIGSITLTAAAASIDFLNIPVGYKRFKLSASIGQNHTNTDVIRLRFNADAGNNYNYQYIQSDGGGLVSGSLANQTQFATYATNNTASIANVFLWDISNELGRTKGITYIGGHQTQNGFVTGYWNSTAQINQISILAPNSTFKVGSSALLLGTTS